MKTLVIAFSLCAALVGCTDEQADKAKNAAEKIDTSIISGRTNLSFDACKMSHNERMSWGRAHCPSKDNDTAKMCRKIVDAADDCSPKNPTRF